MRIKIEQIIQDNKKIITELEEIEKNGYKTYDTYEDWLLIAIQNHQKQIIQCYKELYKISKENQEPLLKMMEEIQELPMITIEIEKEKRKTIGTILKEWLESIAKKFNVSRID